MKKLTWKAAEHNSKNIRFYHANLSRSTSLMLSYFRGRDKDRRWEVSSDSRVICTAPTRKECEEKLARAIANTWGFMAL